MSQVRPSIAPKSDLELKVRASKGDSKESDLGGLDLSRRGLNRDSRSRRQKRVSLDGRENLDSFKNLVSTIKIS